VKDFLETQTNKKRTEYTANEMNGDSSKGERNKTE
jgi:hypothetical protein